MKAGDSFSVGFLTILEHRRHGLFGGYLVLNRVGRPLEFHCTAPVKPNRTQQILYGPTLKSFYYGERIGLALVEKSALSPACVLTDRQDAVSLSGHIKTPVGLVIPTETLETDSEDNRETNYQDSPTIATETTVGQSLDQFTAQVAGVEYQLRVPSAHNDAWTEIVQTFAGDDIQIDLIEPFSRIREAIEEAGKSFRRAS